MTKPKTKFEDVPDTIAWPTKIRSRRADGRIIGTDNSVWLCKMLRPQVIAEAKTVNEMMSAMMPVTSLIEELAASTPSTVGGRRTSKMSYRKIHIIGINLPQRWVPERKKDNFEYLRSSFPSVPTFERAVLVLVQLKPAAVSGTSTKFFDKVKDTVGSYIETFTGVGVPIDDFDRDLELIGSMMMRSGLVNPSARALKIADSWFTLGGPADVPVIEHAQHVHVFRDLETMATAQRAGASDCDLWPANMRGETTFTMAAVEDLTYEGAAPSDLASLWAHQLYHSGSGALAISVRGLVEPAKNTAKELARQRTINKRSLEQLVEDGKESRADLEEKLLELSTMEDRYRLGNASATLHEASILVALDGALTPDDLDRENQFNVAQLRHMEFRQLAGQFETMPASNVRANPLLLDLPAVNVASSGIHSLSQVGDSDGALLGFTEHDRQPVRVSPQAASATDAAPYLAIFGATGSGKTVCALNLADQFARAGASGVIVDPKTHENEADSLATAVELSGGTTQTLSDILKSGGVFDPIGFAPNPQEGVAIATSILMFINPWGTEAINYETDLSSALWYGVQQGATCTGQALRIAQRDRKDPLLDEIVNQLFKARDSNPQLAAIIGIDPNVQPLRVSQGITLIEVGSSHLDLPEGGSVATSQSQRIAMALVRMMVFGSSMAMMGRGGFVMLDEAWIFMSAGKSEMDRLGRLARSQNVLPVFMTQRAVDAIKAELQGYISRGIILPLNDDVEAQAALSLFKVEPTPQRIDRITAKAFIAGESSIDDKDEDADPGFNWGSMRALVHPVTRKVARGAIALHIDLTGQMVPVEVMIPPTFMADVSTNPKDRAARLLEKQKQGLM